MTRAVMDLGLGIVVMGLCAFAGQHVIRKLWRGDQDATRRLDAVYSTFTTKHIGRGLVRAFPIVGVAVFFLGLSFTMFSAMDVFKLPGGVAKLFGLTALIIGLASILTGVLGQVLVVLFNQPRFVVPPHMRGEAGWVAQLLHSDRRANSARRRD